MSLNPEDASAGAPPFDTTEQQAAPPAAAPKQPTVVQTSLAVVKTTVKQFDSAEAGLARLEKKYADVVFDVTTTKGMKEATEARAAVRAPRYAVKKALDDAKRPLNELKAAMTQRAEELTNRILALETPIDQQIKVEEQRKEAEKAAREEADRKRLLAITERIAAIRATATRAAECRTAERVGQILAALEATDMTGFDEFEAEAQAAHTIALDAVRTLHQAKQADEREREERRQAQEAEEARLKKQREELAAQQAAMAAAQKELDDKRAAFEAEQAAAAAAAEAAEAARRAAADADEAKRLALAEAEQRELEAKAEAEATAPAPAPAPAATYTQRPMSDREWAALPAGDRELPHEQVYGTPAPTASQELATAVEWKAPSPGAQVSHQVQLDAYEFLTGQPAATDEDVREQPGVRLNADLLMEIAVESVASYFEITEAEAVAALASITHWSYRATATA